MATPVLVPVSEYLSTTYRPDVDYIDGELPERNLGEQPHAHVQGILSGIFRENRKIWGVRPIPEQRLQINSSRYRIPDVCVVRNTDGKDRIIDFTPLLCVEVLSSEDRMSRMQDRVNDYASIGVRTTWVIDPWKRVGYHATERGFVKPEDGILRLEGTPIQVVLADVFAELDEF
jgi:Uma2 family endonuclease